MDPIDTNHVRVTTTVGSIIRSTVRGVATFLPPDRWEFRGAMLVGSRKRADVVTRYRLVPIGPARSELATDIHIETSGRMLGRFLSRFGQLGFERLYDRIVATLVSDARRDIPDAGPVEVGIPLLSRHGVEEH